jgi:hypothetical protein
MSTGVERTAAPAAGILIHVRSKPIWPYRRPSRGWEMQSVSRGVTIKCQDWIHPDAVFTQSTRFSFHPPAIAFGAIFLGAIGGLGQPKQGKSRGDVRLAHSVSLAAVPENVATVVEVILGGGTVADVGKAFGAKGGNADRRGGAELLAAGRWAKLAWPQPARCQVAPPEPLKP